jgi:transcriptional regulator with XRE-family HTH domain
MYDVDNINTVIGANIRKLRKNAGLTARQLGSLIGKSQSTVSDWERAIKTPKAGMLQELATQLGVSMSDLITDIPEAERAILPNSTDLIDLEGLLKSKARLVFDNKVLSERAKAAIIHHISAVADFDD